jgi:hypothetical protein
MVHPRELIADIFGIDDSLFEVGDRLEYEENAWRRYMFNKPMDEIGVYVLYKGDKIVYIGFSKQLHIRIRSHCYNKKIQWDIFEKYLIGCALMSRFIEENLIIYYKPTYNNISRPNHFIH